MIETELGASSTISVTRDAARDLLDGDEVGVDVSLAVGAHLDALLHRPEARVRDRHVVNTDRERERRRRQPPLAAVDGHEGVSHLGGHEERSRQRLELHGDGRIVAPATTLAIVAFVW